MRAATNLSVFLLCLTLISGIPGLAGTAAAQQQEKRIALVIGNGAYAKGPLATAANDAGLIAQTLQAAGFEVVGARDLDGDGLRKSFRDFIQKAESSGPDTVAMVYLAGYGIQLAGENYFIPVDSAIGRETDIPTEAVRINDYVRQLGSLPLKVSMVVLDAARQQPFIEGGQPIASGLALVEPLSRMLIAFNAAPGTVVPSEQGPYGAYAQSLAEMIRTGGLPLPELFDRVRLRVNEASKGAQVPWHAHKLDTNFVFFDRAPDAPAQPPPDQVAAIRNRPIRDLGASDAYAAALERDTLPAYEEFVSAYPGDPLAKRVRALAAARREAITWERTYRADTPPAYWSYLRRYPRGAHAADAHRRLSILAASLEPPPSFAAIDYDVPPPPPDEVVYVDRPVLMFSDPEFDFVPPPPPPVFFLPPPPPEFVVLEPPPPPIGLYILPQPLFVPIPVYVRAPVYVVAPRNNIIYANIHNRRMIDTVINRPPPPAPVAPGSPAAQGGAKLGIPVAAPNAASPALPPSVAQKATLIQQGKLPVPASASINPAVKPGAPGAPGTPPGAPGAPLGARGGAAANAPPPVNVPPNAQPQGQPLPRANTLPVPGAKGAPPPPPSAATGAPAAVNPSARTGTPPAQQGATLPPSAAPGAAGPGAAQKGPPTANVPPPAAAVPRAGGPPPTGGKPVGPDSLPRQGTAPGAAPPSAANLPPKPNATVAPKPPQSAPPTATAPPARPAPQLARPTPAPPPPRITAPPPPRVSAPPPPRPAPQIARPSPPPPPRISAPPPPVARAAPPPQMARPAPPPPVARAAPPPPAAAKRCPPNNPRC
jgi:uncharacterized caspase-like protein